MNIVEEYEKEIEGKLVSITVHYEPDKEFPYYAISSPLNISGVGKTLIAAKEKCENAIKIDIRLNS